MEMSSGRSSLEKAFSNLLGFEDGASDVLDHLLTIESIEDLLEYLSQLLGDTTTEVLNFVEDVGRFKRGEPLKFHAEDSGQYDSEIKGDLQSVAVPSPSRDALSKQELPQPIRNEKAVVQARRNQKQKSRVPPPKRNKPSSQLKEAKAFSEAHSESLPKMQLETSAPNESREASQEMQKSRPSRGKASRVCGCFGTIHKPLTNCLYCGRIACMEEGYDFCPFCGFMLEDFNDGIHDNDAAWIQKERLLRFDREFAKRTEIFDDQADYQGPSIWMTDEENTIAQENASKRMEDLKRPKQVLNISI